MSHGVVFKGLNRSTFLEHLLLDQNNIARVSYGPVLPPAFEPKFLALDTLELSL